MDDSAWLGLGIGIAIGGIYAWLQLVALRKNEQRQKQGGEVRMGAMLPGSMTRVALLLGSLVLVQVLVPKELKTTKFLWTLTISLAVTYSVPFFWKLKGLWSAGK